MSRLIIITALVSILLIGCAPMKERQERARNTLDRITDFIVESIEAARNIQQAVAGPLLQSARRIQTISTELSERAERVQEGTGKVTKAFTDIKEGVDEIKGALNVSGSGSGEVRE